MTSSSRAAAVRTLDQMPSAPLGDGKAAAFANQQVAGEAAAVLGNGGHNLRAQAAGGMRVGQGKGAGGQDVAACRGSPCSKTAHSIKTGSPASGSS